MGELPATITDFAARAAEFLPAGAHGYYAGGSGDEVTLRDNEAAWRRLALVPRVLVDVASVDTSVEVLGSVLPHPIVIAPTAFHRAATPEGEAATARAAAATDSVYCLSSLATATIEGVAAAAPGGRRWFQLYVFKDRGIARDMVAEAREHGYEALVVTVDLPVFGIRDRDRRTAFTVGDAQGVPNVGRTEVSGTLTPAQVAEQIDPSLRWADIEAFAAECGMPVLVKGVLTAADARLAVDHGAAGIVVSNHGGRQLDTVLAGADALPAVVEEVGGEIEVLVDGGIRRGTDVAKALALGARAVMVGRPVLWGLAVDGEAGAAAVLDLMRAEFENALALLGCPRAGALGHSFIAPAPWRSMA